MKPIAAVLRCLALGFGILSLLPQNLVAAPKKVLVVTATYGFTHSCIPLSEQVLTKLSQESKAYTIVDFVRSGPRPGDKAQEAKWQEQVKQQLAERMSPQALKQYDGVIFDNTTGDLPVPDMNAFLAWIKQGGAFMGMHAASDTFHSCPEFVELLGGEFLTHGPQVHVDCINQDPKHPATEHFGSIYPVFDEIYQFKNFFRPKVHGLLGLDRHPNNHNPGDYPVSWCKIVGKGKVFYTSLGHREDVWESASYQKHILGGIQWALGLKKGDATPQDPTLKLSRAERKEGFKPLFNGVDLLGWSPRSTRTNSWSAQNGMLVNSDPRGIDLISNEKFWNFTVRYEYLIPTNGNSGVYVHGRDELQIADDYSVGKPTVEGNAAIYNLAAPARFVSRPPGTWQTVDLTVINNRWTLILNGEKVYENLLVDRPSAGALDNNVTQAGPFVLQGTHGTVAFRNMRIKTIGN